MQFPARGCSSDDSGDTEEALNENSEQMGALLMTGLRKLQEQYPGTGDVRGRGLMVPLNSARQMVIPG